MSRPTVGPIALDPRRDDRICRAEIEAAIEAEKAASKRRREIADATVSNYDAWIAAEIAEREAGGA